MSRCCPVPDCNGDLVRGQLLCRAHWDALRDDEREAIWRTWRTLQAWRGRCDRATLERHVAAYRDAVASVVERFDHRFKDVFGHRINPRMVELPFGGVAR